MYPAGLPPQQYALAPNSGYGPIPYTINMQHMVANQMQYMRMNNSNMPTSNPGGGQMLSSANQVGIAGGATMMRMQQQPMPNQAYFLNYQGYAGQQPIQSGPSVENSQAAILAAKPNAGTGTADAGMYYPPPDVIYNPPQQGYPHPQSHSGNIAMHSMPGAAEPSTDPAGGGKHQRPNPQPGHYPIQYYAQSSSNQAYAQQGYRSADVASSSMGNGFSAMSAPQMHQPAIALAQPVSQQQPSSFDSAAARTVNSQIVAAATASSVLGSQQPPST